MSTGLRTLVAATLATSTIAIGCGDREVAPPNASRNPALEAPPPVVHPHVDRRCLDLCEHSGVCLDARGEPRDAERDCVASCRPGGVYAAMPEAALACSVHADCDALRACSDATIEALLGVDGAPSASLAEPGARDAPTWPDGFPVIPGGSPLPTSGDPLTLARVAYAGTPEGLESLLRGELARDGWQVDGSTADDGAVRFFARREGVEIGVAVYRETPDRSVLQLFGFQMLGTGP